MNGLLHVSTLLSPCELMFPGLFSLENWIPSGRSTSTRITGTARGICGEDGICYMWLPVGPHEAEAGAA